jgi:hypothetical protein
MDTIINRVRDDWSTSSSEKRGGSAVLVSTLAALDSGAGMLNPDCGLRVWGCLIGER